MDVAIIDTVWNGVWQSMKIAALAEAHEVNVAPHNFYGHLCTMMNAHFAAAVPNLRIMEIDIDRLPWDDELFTHPPRVSRTAIWWCPTAPAGAPSRTRTRSRRIRRSRTADWISGRHRRCGLTTCLRNTASGRWSKMRAC